MYQVQGSPVREGVEAHTVLVGPRPYRPKLWFYIGGSFLHHPHPPATRQNRLAPEGL